MEVFTTMIIISRFSTGLQGTGARVRPPLKAALVSVGLWLMGSRWTGRPLTRLVRAVVTALMRRGGLADA
jgi:hypothetical protein